MKYTGIALIVLAAGSSMLSYQLFAAERNATERGSPGISDLYGLDQQLAGKVLEIVRTARSLQNHLDRQGTETLPYGPDEPILEGTLERAPVSAPVSMPARPVLPPRPAETKPAPIAPPWWQGYSVTIISASEQGNYAVINGKLLVEGQDIDPAVKLARIEKDAVIISHAADEHRLQLKPEGTRQ